MVPTSAGAGVAVASGSMRVTAMSSSAVRSVCSRVGPMIACPDLGASNGTRYTRCEPTAHIGYSKTLSGRGRTTADGTVGGARPDVRVKPERPDEGGYAMGVRTGDEYRAALRDGREVWHAGQQVADVTVHPGFRGA